MLFDEQALKVDAVKLNQALWTELCFLQTFEVCRCCVASFRMAECRHVCGRDLFGVRNVRFNICG